MEISNDKLVELNTLPTLLIKTYEFESFIMGYHVYKTIWTPFEGEELTAIMEPQNIEDKFAVAITREEHGSPVGHLPKGRSGRFAKTIFYFLRANDLNTCTLVVTGKVVNEGDGKGMKVPCRLLFSAEPQFINILKEQLRIISV